MSQYPCLPVQTSTPIVTPPTNCGVCTDATLETGWPPSVEGERHRRLSAALGKRRISRLHDTIANHAGDIDSSRGPARGLWRAARACGVGAESVYHATDAPRCRRSVECLPAWATVCAAW